MVKKKGSPVDSLLLPDGILLFLSQVDQNFKNLDSTCRHFGTGTEYGDSTCVEQELVVLMRNNTTHVNEDVFTSQFLQFCDNVLEKILRQHERRFQRLVLRFPPGFGTTVPYPRRSQGLRNP